MNSVKRFLSQSNRFLSQSSKYPYILKSFEELHNNDIVYHPQIKYIEQKLFKLNIYTNAKSIDQYKKRSDFSYFVSNEIDKNTLETIDNDDSHIISIGDHTYQQSGFDRTYGYWSVRFRKSYPVLDMKSMKNGIMKFNDTKFHDIQEGDIVMENHTMTMEGHLKLTEFVDDKQNNKRTTHQLTIMQEKIHEVFGSPFWIGDVLDMDLWQFQNKNIQTNKFQNNEYAVFPYSMHYLKLNGLTDTDKFKVLAERCLDEVELNIPVNTITEEIYPHVKRYPYQPLELQIQ